MCGSAIFGCFIYTAQSYQEKTHDAIERTLARDDFFVAYLSDFPTLHINHSVLVYGRKGRTRAGRNRSLSGFTTRIIPTARAS